MINELKSYILFTLLLLVIVPASAANMTLPIRGVADGDTIKTTLKLPCPLCNVSVRILDIDTPESNYLAKCPAEKAKGLEAKAFLKEFVTGEPTMLVTSFKWDKYGGRINGHVSVKGTDIATLLIRKGYAKHYTGQGPKPNWCD